jgi:protein gp37
MSAKTNISWTSRTQNFWMGCTKISTGCARCYMYADMKRYGRDPTKVTRTSVQTWNQILKWQKDAAAKGVNEMVFTCSWSDFFIEDADAWRPEAWELIKKCPNLIFQILTKRPELIKKRLPPDWGDGYPNVALGVSVENKRYLWRMNKLRKIPAALRFISAEPLLGPLTGLNLDGFGWIIVGAETGPKHRPMKAIWAIRILQACREKNIPFFYKQGSHALPGRNIELNGKSKLKGKEVFIVNNEIIQEWPEGWHRQQPDETKESLRISLPMVEPPTLPTLGVNEILQEGVAVPLL